MEGPQQPVGAAERKTGFPSKPAHCPPSGGQRWPQGGQGELRGRSVLQVFARAVGGKGC